MTDSTDRLAQLADDVDALIKPRELGQWVQPDRHDPNTAALPTLAATRASGFYWPPATQARLGVHPSLLTQLEQLRDGYTAPVSESGGGRTTPGPRFTGGADVADLVVEISTGTTQLLVDALRDLRAAQPTVRAQSLDTRDRLRHLARIAEAVDGKIRDRICRQIHSWANAARLVLSYTAPMATLNKPCPYCGQQSLIVRSDASSDAFCTTEDCTDGAGERPRWPRHLWPQLLTSTSKGA